METEPLHAELSGAALGGSQPPRALLDPQSPWMWVSGKGRTGGWENVLVILANLPIRSVVWATCVFKEERRAGVSLPRGLLVGLRAINNCHDVWKC